MCGIAAIYNYRDDIQVDRAEMRRMLDRMKLRGPDGEGQWYSANGAVGLGHKRLAIIDLSESGAQPMHSPDGRLVISFNGEIYNYKALRAELQAGGSQFSSNSDTEILLHLYQRDGAAMVQRLRGMFAFALWDERKRGLLLVRDHLGIKPLYYSIEGATVRVASQIKALLATGVIDREPDPAGHTGFFLWGHIPEPYTLYKRIKALPAGSTLWVDQNGPGAPKVYCDVTTVFADAERDADHNARDNPGILREQVREALLDSVRHHLVADVPVGVFLSGGLDSTTLAALATETGGNLRSVTLGFEEFRGTPQDETELAELVARKYGTQHQTVWIKRETFCENFARLLDAMDSPTIDGVNSFFISAAAQQAGLKVVMSGVGADELFGGYSSFREIPRLVGMGRVFRAMPAFSRLVRRVTAPLVGRVTSPKYASVLEYGGSYESAYFLRHSLFLPWELDEVFEPKFVTEGLAALDVTPMDGETAGNLSPHLKVSALETRWYLRNQLLRDTDWASMSHSLEVRAPFTDIELIRRIAPLIAASARLTKQDMAAAARPELPRAILDRPKTGFLIPVREWLAGGPPLVNGTEAPASGGPTAATGSERRLRGWSKLVYQHFTS